LKSEIQVYIKPIELFHCSEQLFWSSLVDFIKNYT
jgi:hypothetical protein